MKAEDSFVDARSVGIDPDVARRANAMFSEWNRSIEKHFPDAMENSDEERDIVIRGASYLIGQILGMVWLDHDKRTAIEYFHQIERFMNTKMEHFYLEVMDGADAVRRNNT